MSEYQNCLLCSSISKTDENVDWVKELVFETEEYIFLNLLMSGNSVWVSPEHFERQSNYELDVRWVCVSYILLCTVLCLSEFLLKLALLPRSHKQHILLSVNYFVFQKLKMVWGDRKLNVINIMQADSWYTRQCFDRRRDHWASCMKWKETTLKGTTLIKNEAFLLWGNKCCAYIIWSNTCLYKCT